MANSIAYAQKFAPIIDDIYKYGAVTADLDTGTNPGFEGVKTVQVLKVSTTGLGDYSRTNGYPAGDVTAEWETLTLEEERGKELSIDRMDNEETLGMAFGQVTGQFMKQHVIPELDAYRFAKYASATGISTTSAAVLSSNTILAAIDEAVRQLDEDEVPAEGRKLYINSDLKPIFNGALTRQYGNDSVVNTVVAGYNNLPIKWAPKSRFYTGITLNSGDTSWGYKRTTASQSFTGDGTTTKFTITAKPTSTAIVNIIVAGTATTAYTYVAASGEITFTAAPANAAAIIVTYYTAAPINFMIIYPEAVCQVAKFALPKIFDPDTNQKKDAWLFQFREYHDAFTYENKVKGIYLHKSTF